MADMRAGTRISRAHRLIVSCVADLRQESGGPIRVLRVIARMNVGGPAVEIGGLMTHLPAKGYEGVLLAGHPEPDEGEMIPPETLESVRRIPSLRRRVGVLGDLIALVTIVRVIREFHPHIVHTHTAKAGVLGRLAAFLTGVPVVIHTYHGHLLHGYFSPRVTSVVVRLERWLARRTTLIASVGETVRDELLAAGVGTLGQYWVVPPGVEPPTRHERHQARKSLGVPAEALIVTYVGRLAPIKRMDRFIEMAHDLAQRRDDYHFLIVGGGDLESAKRLTRSIRHRTTFTGWISDLGPAYSASDVVVLSSDNEGMPVSLIEAQMCGVPVVATDVGSVSEVMVVGKSGLLVQPSPSALANAVESVVMGELEWSPAVIREWSQDRFAVRKLVDATAEMYREALARKGVVDV